MVLKRMEPVMGGREGLTVGWVVEKIEKARDDKERQCIESWDTECNKCIIFYQYFKCKIFYTNLPWVVSLTENILLLTKHFTSKQTP